MQIQCRIKVGAIDATALGPLLKIGPRMKAYDDVHQTFGFLSELMSLNIEQIEDKAKNLVSAYPEDLEDTLMVAELIQFVAFMRTQKPASANESAELPCTRFCHH